MRGREANAADRAVFGTRMCVRVRYSISGLYGDQKFQGFAAWEVNKAALIRLELRKLTESHLRFGSYPVTESVQEVAVMSWTAEVHGYTPLNNGAFQDDDATLQRQAKDA